MAKTAKILLFVLGFAIVLSIVSNAFDYDFGWHLRFGQDAAGGRFPYLDAYTWSFQNKPWTNHEWGGDLLYWWLYSRFGYFSLVLTTSLAVWAAFLIILKTYSRLLSATNLLAAAICIWSVGHIFVMRLSMLVLPLFAVLLWSLEKIGRGRWRLVWLWPPLFWLWSALHGSWILGFITVNIYLLGSLAQNIAPLKWQKFLPGEKWTGKIFLAVVLGELAAAAAILLNPYGLQIWREVAQYFSFSYFKTHIVEWLPSYTFPVYWKPLAIQAVGLALAAVAYIRKKISVRQALLFVAFSFSAWMYKRNAIFMVMLATPLIGGALAFAAQELKKNNSLSVWLADARVRKTLLLFAIAGLACTGGYYLFTTRFTADVWHDRPLLEYNSLPYAAVEFLKEETGGEKINIFNDFNWGGYLIWQIPSALVYLDGRSAATWAADDGRTMLEKYFAIMDEPGGLQNLERNNVRFVIMKKSNFLPIAPPDAVNRFIFGSNLAGVVKTEQTLLEQNLNSSGDWQLIYSDRMSNVWKSKK